MKKQTTIAAKVMKNLSWITIVMYLIMLVVIGSVAETSINHLEQDYLEEISLNISSNIDRTIHEYVSIAEILSCNALIVDYMSQTTRFNSPRDYESLAALQEELTAIRSKFNDTILCIALMEIDQDGYFLDDGSISDSSFSFKNRPYYNVVNTGNYMITDPYVDTLTGGMVVSVVAPVISNNVALGAVVIDVSCDFISELVTANDFDNSGTSFILDVNGNVVGAHDRNEAGKSYTLLGVTGDDFATELSQKTGHFFEFKINNMEKVGIITPVGNMGWATVTSLGMHDYSEHANEVLRILLAMLIVSLIITILITYQTIKKSLSPLDQLTEAMGEIGKGNLHFKLEHQSNDEMGILADDLRSTSKTLAMYIDEIDSQLEHFGRGDFTYEPSIEFIGDFKNIQTSIARFDSLMSQTLTNLATTIGQVTLGASQVSQGSQSLAMGSEKQTGDIDTLTQNVQTITDTVKQNAKTAEEANELGSSVTDIMQESTEHMNELLEAITLIQTSSTDIEKIIKTIDDIAFQTNILALNAAVEAARAGSAGKGFAVVADEVRNLAQKSTEAAQGTTALIQNSLDAVIKGVNIANNTNESFVKVDESARQVVELVAQISEVSTNQAQSIQEISEGLTQISTVVQQNSAISEENSAVAQQLSSQSEIMNSSIKHFKID